MRETVDDPEVDGAAAIGAQGAPGEPGDDPAAEIESLMRALRRRLTLDLEPAIAAYRTRKSLGADILLQGALVRFRLALDEFETAIFQSRPF